MRAVDFPPVIHLFSESKWFFQKKNANNKSEPLKVFFFAQRLIIQHLD